MSGSTDNMDYVFGYYTLEDDAYTANPQSYFGGMNAIAQNYSGTSDAKAFFGQVTWSVADKWGFNPWSKKN